MLFVFCLFICLVGFSVYTYNIYTAKLGGKIFWVFCCFFFVKRERDQQRFIVVSHFSENQPPCANYDF